jgi:O-acetyl-ADP-ribose deacetylase (regulator of RNase III)
MIREERGDLLKADVEALVNTVNTEGVMGKGIALQFKKAYPEMFREYARLCAEGRLRTGQVHVYSRKELYNPRYIINFPTKRSWRERTKLEYISRGLQSLVSEIKKYQIRSVALPALGTGLGGLDWKQVYPLIKSAFAELPDVEVLVYPPQTAPNADEIVHRTPRPQMTLARANVLHVLDAYTVLGNTLTVLTAQKLLYFLQEAGEPLNLRFDKYWYGPYADNLRHVLNRFEGHFIKGFADGRNAPATTLRLLPDAIEEAERIIDQQRVHNMNSEARLQRVLTLIKGFESPYGMELLASVHWVAHHNKSVHDSESALQAIQQWSKDKRNRLRPDHVRIAWQRLEEQGWLDIAVSTATESAQD